ncbi:glycosyltransferase [Mucilaginibacter sp.]
MPKIENKTCAITVTYGNRWHLVNQIINRLLRLDHISNIVVVNNGSGYNVKEKLNELNDDRVILVDCEENLGSAGGYNRGIAYAHQNTDADFFWLLDDDNLPEEDALAALLNSRSEINMPNDQLALLSLRTDRELDHKFAHGADPYKYYLIPDDFLGFSFLRIGRNKLMKLVQKRKQQSTVVNQMLDKVKMPYAPYGGFFFHREMADKIGYPDERFYLYVDDEEYTYRVTGNGGSIWLIPASKINDIDTTDVRVEYKLSQFSSKYLDLWNFRMYYRVRNSIYFHKKTTLKNPVIFNINKMLFLGKLKALSIISSKQKEYSEFVAAVTDGLQGKLGKATWKNFK